MFLSLTCGLGRTVTQATGRSPVLVAWNSSQAQVPGCFFLCPITRACSIPQKATKNLLTNGNSSLHKQEKQETDNKFLFPKFYLPCFLVHLREKEEKCRMHCILQNTLEPSQFVCPSKQHYFKFNILRPSMGSGTTLLPQNKMHPRTKN